MFLVAKDEMHNPLVQTKLPPKHVSLLTPAQGHCI